MIHPLDWCIHRTMCARVSVNHRECGINYFLLAVIEHDQRAGGAVAAVAALAFGGVV